MCSRLSILSSTLGLISANCPGVSMGINYAALYEESPRHTDDIWSLTISDTANPSPERERAYRHACSIGTARPYWDCIVRGGAVRT